MRPLPVCTAVREMVVLCSHTLPNWKINMETCCYELHGYIEPPSAFCFTSNFGAVPGKLTLWGTSYLACNLLDTTSRKQFCSDGPSY
jgi:hypothetical protein